MNKIIKVGSIATGFLLAFAPGETSLAIGARLKQVSSYTAVPTQSTLFLENELNGMTFHYDQKSRTLYAVKVELSNPSPEMTYTGFLSAFSVESDYSLKQRPLRGKFFMPQSELPTAIRFHNIALGPNGHLYTAGCATWECNETQIDEWDANALVRSTILPSLSPDVDVTELLVSTDGSLLASSSIDDPMEYIQAFRFLSPNLELVRSMDVFSQSPVSYAYLESAAAFAVTEMENGISFYDTSGNFLHQFRDDPTQPFSVGALSTDETGTFIRYNSHEEFEVRQFKSGDLIRKFKPKVDSFDAQSMKYSRNQMVSYTMDGTSRSRIRIVQKTDGQVAAEKKVTINKRPYGDRYGLLNAGEIVSYVSENKLDENGNPINDKNGDPIIQHQYATVISCSLQCETLSAPLDFGLVAPRARLLNRGFNSRSGVGTKIFKVDSDHFIGAALLGEFVDSNRRLVRAGMDVRVFRYAKAR